MALPTQAQLQAIDAINGGSASAPLTTEQQQIRSLGQTQSISAPDPVSNPPGPVPVFTQDQVNKSQLPTQTSADTVSAEGAGTVGNTTAKAIQSPGAGAANDDQPKPSQAGRSQALNTTANGPIVAQPNVLDQYASYTYSLSWYVMTPEQFNGLSNGEININNWMLLMQSGGAQANVNDNGKGGRSPYFTLDYYMDNLILTTNCPGGGPGGTLNANNGGELEFTVTEPNGITLPNNLALAYQSAVKSAKGVEATAWAQALYCMVIKFYGYDDDGNLVQAGRAGAQNGATGPGAPRATVQKIYPFTIKDFQFRIASRIVEYKITATCPIYQINASSRRGSIPQAFALVGKTVGDILAGNGSKGTTVSTSPAGDGRNTTAQQTQPPGKGSAGTTERVTSVDEIQYDQLGNPI